MIVVMHVAAGAAAGELARTRGGAVAMGFALHGLQDAVPHEDIPSRPFEIGSGVFLLGLLALRRGPLHRSVLGAAACVAPDLEHVLPLPRPGGRELYPSHRFEGWHRARGIPAWAQLLAAGVIVGLVLRGRER